MNAWAGALLLVLFAVGIGLLFAHSWRLESKERGRDAWERLVRHRSHENRPRMRGNNDDSG